MILVAIGWLYVTVLMAVAEATSANGTLLGAVFTFVLYGALPVALGLYLAGRRARRRGRQKRKPATADGSAQPDGRGKAPAGAAVPPVRKEP